MLVSLGISQKSICLTRSLFQKVLYPEGDLCLLGPRALHNILIAQCSVEAFSAEHESTEQKEDQANRRIILNNLKNKQLTAYDIEWWLQHVNSKTPMLLSALDLPCADDKAEAALRDAKFTLQNC